MYSILYKGMKYVVNQKLKEMCNCWRIEEDLVVEEEYKGLYGRNWYFTAVKISSYHRGTIGINWIWHMDQHFAHTWEKSFEIVHWRFSLI